MNVSYSCNPNIVGKPDEGWRTTRGWQAKTEVDLFELAEDISVKGHPVNWCHFVGGYRQGSNILGNSGGIGIDIDNVPGEPQLTLAEAQEHPVYSTATICYPSPSYGIKGERFRLLWAFPDGGIDPQEGKLLQRELMKYTPGIDTACGSVHNVWYGNQTMEPFWVNVDVPFPLELHRQCLTDWMEAHPTKKTSSSSWSLNSGGSHGGEIGHYDPIIHGCFRDYEQEAIALLKKIPPRGAAGSGTFQAARDSLIVLLRRFGPERTKTLCREANWIGDWDQEAVIDSLFDWLQDSADFHNSFNVGGDSLGWGTLVYHASNNNS